MTKKNFNETVNGVAAVASAKCTNDQQFEKYRYCSGHGFAAEDHTDGCAESAYTGSGTVQTVFGNRLYFHNDSLLRSIDCST